MTSGSPCRDGVWLFTAATLLAGCFDKDQVPLELIKLSFQLCVQHLGAWCHHKLLQQLFACLSLCIPGWKEGLSSDEMFTQGTWRRTPMGQLHAVIMPTEPYLLMA